MPSKAVNDPDIHGHRKLAAAQAEVLAGVSVGLSNEEIANWLDISVRTVESRLSDLSDSSEVARRLATMFAFDHRDCCIARLVNAFPLRSPKIAICHAVTPRQHEVLELLAAGLSDEEMAQRLRAPTATVRSRLHRLYSRIGLSGRAIVIWAMIHAGCSYAACTNL